jgi:hypothetical protein
MNPLGEALNGLVELPADLSAKALEVPGLPERLLRFIRMEVAMNERRQARYSPEVLDLLQRARRLAEQRRSAGESREEGMRGVADHLSAITETP